MINKLNILYYNFQSFYDIRIGLRNKIRKKRLHANQTGGGEPIDIHLEPAEERLMHAMPPEHVDGLPINECGIVSKNI